MTSRRAQFKRARVTLILLGVFLVGLGLVYFVVTKVQEDTDRRVNAIVCVTRPYIEGARARSIQAANDKSQTPAERARARQAIQANDQFLAGLLLHPRNYDCKPLLEKLLREQRAREKAQEARNIHP